MKVYFTGIFETYRVENNFFLINKKGYVTTNS